MRRSMRFFKYLFRDVMDAAVAVTLVGLAVIAGLVVLGTPLVTALTGPVAILTKIVVIAAIVAVSCILVELEVLAIKRMKNGRPSRQPIINVYNYGSDSDEPEDEPEDTVDSDEPTDDAVDSDEPEDTTGDEPDEKTELVQKMVDILTAYKNADSAEKASLIGQMAGILKTVMSKND